VANFYVDTDLGTDDAGHGGSAGAGAWATFAYAESQLTGSLTEASTLWLSGAAADTTATTINGCANTHRLTIKPTPGDEAAKTGWDTGRYRLSVTDADALFIYDDLVTVDNIQIEIVYSSGSGDNCITIDSQTAAGDVTISRNYVRSNGVNSNRGITVNDADTDIDIMGNIIHGCKSRGILMNTSGLTADIYNNIINGAVDLIELQAGVTAVIKNNALMNNGGGEDIDNAGTATVQYNCADDDLNTIHSETTNVQPLSASWANEFVDASNGDYTAKTGGNMEDNGIGPGSDAKVPTPDIDGTTRSGTTCDIGPDEIAAAGGNAPTGALQGPLVGPFGGPVG